MAARCDSRAGDSRAEIEKTLFSDVIVPKDPVDVIDQNGQRLGKFSQSEKGRLEVSKDKIQELREQAKAPQEIPPAAEKETPRKAPTRERGDTPTARLLDRLEQQNAGSALFKDAWTRTLKELVDLGTQQFLNCSRTGRHRRRSHAPLPRLHAASDWRQAGRTSPDSRHPQDVAETRLGHGAERIRSRIIQIRQTARTGPQ